MVSFFRLNMGNNNIPRESKGWRGMLYEGVSSSFISGR